MTRRYLEAMTTPKSSTIKPEFSTTHAASATDENSRMKPHTRGHDLHVAEQKRRNFHSNVVTETNQNLVQLSQFSLPNEPQLYKLSLFASLRHKNVF